MNDRSNFEVNPEIKEIDLIDLIIRIWRKRKYVFKVSGLFSIIGLIFAFSIPKEYETKVMLVPEQSAKSSFSGSIGSLASLAGIALGTGLSEDAISPELYPQMISSVPFLIDLFDVEVESKKGDINTTLFDYQDNYQKTFWLGHIMSMPFEGLRWLVSLGKDKEIDNNNIVNPFWLTKDQEKIVKSLKKNIVASVEKKTGIISISVRMQDPLISAVVADSVKNKLQEYIISYRTKKAQQDLIFMEKLFQEAQEEYYSTQQTYVNFVDGNMNIVLAKYKAEEERLENEMDLAYNIYNQLAQQLQLARAKVQENTPVYAILQPPSVPNRPVKPNKIMILLLSVVVGGLFASSIILYKDKFNKK